MSHCDLLIYVDMNILDNINVKKNFVEIIILQEKYKKL